MSNRSQESPAVRPPDRHTPVGQWAILVGWVLLAAVVLLSGLGDRPLEDWDEAIYAEVAKQMVLTGEWLTPHWNGAVWFEKPPLLMWLTAVAYSWFEVGEMAARLPAALAGIALVALTFGLARRLGPSGWLGPLAAGGLLASMHFLQYARFGTTDMLLTTFVYLSLAGYWRVRQDGDGRGWLIVGLGIGLGFMTKSAAIGIVPLVIVVDLLLDGELLAVLRSRSCWLGVGLAAVLVLPWHLYVIATHGLEVLTGSFAEQILNRASTALELNAGPPEYYLARFVAAFLPWSYFVPLAAAKSLSDATAGDATASNRAKRCLLLVILMVLALFGLVATKLPWYMTPMFPALAILVADFIIGAVRRDAPTWQVSGLLLASFLSALHVSGGLAAATAVAIVLTRLTRLASGAWQQAVLVLALVAPSGSIAVRNVRLVQEPVDNPMALMGKHVATWAAQLPMPLLLYREDEPTVVFYSGQPAKEVRSPEELAARLVSDEGCYVVVDLVYLQLLRQQFRARPLAVEERLMALVVQSRTTPP